MPKIDMWGGPAKGKGRGGPAKPFAKGNKAAVGADHSHPVDRKARREMLDNHMFHLALNAANEQTQVAAYNAYLNRTEGMPKVTQEISGAGGVPLATEIKVTFVKPGE